MSCRPTSACDTMATHSEETDSLGIQYKLCHHMTHVEITNRLQQTCHEIVDEKSVLFVTLTCVCVT